MRNTWRYSRKGVLFCQDALCKAKLSSYSRCSKRWSGVTQNFPFDRHTSWTLKSHAPQRARGTVLENLIAHCKSFYMFTLITLWPYKPWITHATERSPLAMTVPPFATGWLLLHAGALAIDEWTAWHSVVGFSWGAKVIELKRRRWNTLEKYDSMEVRKIKDCTPLPLKSRGKGITNNKQNGIFTLNVRNLQSYRF